MYYLYCNVGEMNCYDGCDNEKPSGGGAYNKDHIGHEVNNFTVIDGIYYGYVQSRGETIDISRHFGAGKKDDYVDDITVIWFAKHRVVGYYRNARVYRKVQHLKKELANFRVYDDYNISSDKAQLISPYERNFIIVGNGQSNTWFGNSEIDARIEEYISSYEEQIAHTEADVYDFERPLEGFEKDALVKVRVNQDRFRALMLKRYGSKCCICKVHSKELLIASHIKPWSRCNNSEKVSEFNGMLLCPNHDKLFDLGFISFSDAGKMLISNELDEVDRVFLNVVPGMNVSICEEMKPYLKYHRESVFRG